MVLSSVEPQESKAGRSSVKGMVAKITHSLSINFYFVSLREKFVEILWRGRFNSYTNLDFCPYNQMSP